MFVDIKIFDNVVDKLQSNFILFIILYFSLLDLFINLCMYVFFCNANFIPSNGLLINKK